MASSASSSSSENPLLYACIAHNTTILSEHLSSTSSQISNLSTVILPKISHSSPTKQTYTHGSSFIHYIAAAPADYPSTSGPAPSASNLTFLCIAHSSLGQRLPFTFLLDAKAQFLAQYPPQRTDFASLPAYGCGAFNSTLKQLLQQHAASAQGQRDGNGDALAAVRADMADVREVMTDNIERVLERGERIDLLVDKTDRLGGSARDFRVRSTGLRRRMWWKNVKVMTLLVAVVLLLLYLFVGFGCGLPAWGRCLRHDQPIVSYSIDQAFH